MGVEAINSLSDFQNLIKGDVPVIIDFWATWCGPCRVISPIFEQLASKFGPEKIQFRKVDVDERSDISQEVGIRAMPTFMVFKNGEKVGELVGADPGGLQTLITKVIP